MSLFSLQDKSILITGSSKGIGKSIAHQSALMGAKVIISSRKLDACKSTAKEINDDVGEEVAFPIACNIADENQLKNLVEKTIDTLGSIDTLICNAATNTFMGSMLDISKAADVMIVKNIAAEFGHKNIRANSIAPGLIKTDFAKGLWENPDILKAVLHTNPMKRIGDPDEIAGAAIMLSSKAGSYINGQTIVIDGGTIAVG
jgi:NAD(P)-dependent dehydrogenase (short-subunit alcohol dehydrogenase family)